MNRPSLSILRCVLAALFVFAACKPRPAPAQSVEKGDPITTIASLSDPRKLATLKPEARAVNGRLDKIIYWLSVAEQQGIRPEDAITRALATNGTTEPRLSMVKTQTVLNYQARKRWGLLTAENLDRLKRGNAALVTKGSYIGDKAEVDHIVPLSRYPQFANELANLQLMPARDNRSKGDRMGEVEFAKLAELRKLTAPVRSRQNP